MGEAEAYEPIVVATCAPCQYHWTETSKETRVGAALFGLIVFTVVVAVAKGKVTLFTGCLSATIAVLVMGAIVHLAFGQKLDPGCRSGPNGPIQAKRTEEGKLELTFWNPRFAREFGLRNGAPEEQLKGILPEGS
jgi:hypothetical protein